MDFLKDSSSSLQCLSLLPPLLSALSFYACRSLKRTLSLQGSSNSAQTETVRTEKPRTSDKTEQSGKDDKDSSKPTEKPAASDGVDPDFKAAMDEYEAFIDEYIKFIKNIEEEGKPVSMLADYTKMMTQYSEFAAAMAEYESEELSDADAAYLIHVNARVQTKLLTLN